jgi:hypothetical protein
LKQSKKPSLKPSAYPSFLPSGAPSVLPSKTPSVLPSFFPSKKSSSCVHDAGGDCSGKPCCAGLTCVSTL